MLELRHVIFFLLLFSLAFNENERENENENENENEYDGVTMRISHGVNAVRAEECNEVDVDIDNSSGMTTHPRSSIPPPPPPAIM